MKTHPSCTLTARAGRGSKLAYRGPLTAALIEDLEKIPDIVIREIVRIEGDGVSVVVLTDPPPDREGEPEIKNLAQLLAAKIG